MNINNFALIIGAMKCGTTSLFNYLSQHPEISPCRHKEPLFFCLDRQYRQGVEYYQSLWDWNEATHKVALESTVGYSRITHPPYANAAANIAQIAAKHNVNFKFIYIMRDPIERIESHYTQGRKHQHKDTAKPLSEGIQPEIIDTSRYAMQLDEYYSRFPSENILLLCFEDFKKDPLEILKKVCCFLDLNPNYPFEKLDLNHNQYSSKVRRVAIPGYKSVRSTELANALLKKIPYGLKSKLNIFRDLLSGQFENKYVRLSPKQKQYVLEQLSSDISTLEAKHKFNTDNWNLKVQSKTASN